MDNMQNMDNILSSESDKENDPEENYRNAIKLLFHNANGRKKAEYFNTPREATEAFYGYMFGEHIAANESDKLFAPSKYDDANAEIKGNDSSSQFYDYISGYREAASLLIMNALIKGDTRTKDELIFPICFLYHQYIELTLKDLYLYYSNDSEEEKDKFIKKTNHKLIHVWNEKIVPMIKPLFVEESEINEFNLIESYINEFNNLDSDSFVFRYPIDKSRTLYHKTSQKINLPALMEKMESQVEDFFAYTSAHLDIYKMRNDVNNYRIKALECIENEKYDEAVQLYNKALELKRRWNGDEHSDVIFLYIEIASIYTMQDKSTEALDFLSKALDISIRINNSVFLSTIYQHMGMNESMQKNYLKALELYEKSMEYAEEDDSYAINTYLYAARVGHTLKDFLKAKKYYEKAMFLSNKILGSNHIESVNLSKEIESFNNNKAD